MLEHIIIVDYCYEYLVNQISIGLLLYAHIPASLSALFFSIYILLKTKSYTSKLLFGICGTFALWSFFALSTWFSFLGPENTMFTWSLLDLLGILLFFFSYYFLYTFNTNKEIPNWQKYVSIILILPTAIFTFFGKTLPIYDANSCIAVENAWMTAYPFFAQAILLFSSITFVIKNYFKSNDAIQKKKVLLSGLGILTFLFFFFSVTLLVAILSESDVSSYVYNYEIYGLFGMPILLIFLGYLIVRYQAFNMKVFATQALVTWLIVLIASEFAFVTTFAGQVLVGFTLLIMSAVGAMLTHSVKKEIEQREQIAKLADTLQKANERLKELDKMKSEFVSIASHQLRSPLTSIRGYASMLAEGSYGKLPAKAQEVIQNIADSSMYMVRSVEDYLSVSRIEAGNMKYEMSDFSLKETAERLVDELRAVAIKKGLVLVFRSDCSGNGTIHADIGKTRQVLQNLIDNSMKYTPKGTITVIAHDDLKKKKMYVTIHDTGVGMSPETLEEVFDKFVRAKNANSINVTGTGLGLFVAKKMMDSMGGKVWAESEGEGMGSTFHVEFPLVTGK